MNKGIFEQLNKGVFSPVVGNIGMFIGLLFILFFCFSSTAFSAPVPPWEIDGLAKKEAPSFQIKDMSGKNISFSDFKGKVVLLNFWATWCGPCRDEMPAFDKVYAKFNEKGLVVLGISIDTNEGLVRSFLNKRPVAFPVAVNVDSGIAQSYKVFTYPTTFLIDRQGVIQEFFLGEQSWDDESFAKKIENLLR